MKQLLWLEAPAKINLTLEVLGKRDDGYHELETIMHKINLCDRLCFRPSFDIEINSNDASIAWDHSNLVYKAASLILKKYLPCQGISVYVEKNIPIEAGLAGGSTDAAATLTGINRIYELGLSYADLLDLAGQLGSDVPFCLLDGPATALATGRGDKLTPLPAHPRLYLVIVKPAFQLSTTAVYRDFNMNHLWQRPNSSSYIAAAQTGTVEQMTAFMVNVLESVSISRVPEIDRIKLQLEQEGALKALMSGSGPSVFGIFENIKAAESAADKLKTTAPNVFVVSSFSERSES